MRPYPKVSGLGLFVGVDKVALEWCPAVVVVLLLHLLASLQAPFRHTYHQRAAEDVSLLFHQALALNLPLEHEGHASVTDLGRLQLGIASPLERIRVRTVRAHHIVQASAGRLEAASSLCVVVSCDQAHELGHGVTVVPWGPEGVLSNEPTRWEDDKVSNGGADVVGGPGQNGIDGGVRVIKRDRPDGVESAEVVLVGVVVAVPCDDVEGGVVLTSGEKCVVELAEQLVLGLLFLVIESSNGGLEVTGIGQAVGPDRAQLW